VIASISGTVTHVGGGQLVVDVNGVGYLVNVSGEIEQSTQVGADIALHTSFIVREDAFSIFGFASREQLSLFDTLRSVSGVGPKLALAILSSLGTEKISLAIAQQDDKVFATVSGIGPKTAKLLTLALEGKVSPTTTLSSNSDTSSVLKALVGLGWSEKEASNVLELVFQKLPESSDDKTVLRAALSHLATTKNVGTK
jgi:Holliday junction DNA helicase RuvA